MRELEHPNIIRLFGVWETPTEVRLAQILLITSSSLFLAYIHSCNHLIRVSDTQAVLEGLNSGEHFCLSLEKHFFTVLLVLATDEWCG
jgi:hypothetical protein